MKTLNEGGAETGPSDGSAPRLVFGIYPGGILGDDADTEIGTPDQPGQTNDALRLLQPAGKSFLVRGYVHYLGPGQHREPAPADMEQYLQEGRKLDLVLCFRPTGGSMADWTHFVRTNITRYGRKLAKIQLAEEPNSTAPGGDGGFPHVRQAIIQGLLAAMDESQRQGLGLEVGFNAVPNFDPADSFWSEVGTLGQHAFPQALDYVGLDFFPDVFRPVASDGSPHDLREMVEVILRHFRQVSLKAAGIPKSIPIHVTEHGWPTGPDRSYARQAAVLEIVVRTVHELRGLLNITHYEHFDLRDASSGIPELFHQFGLIRDDYTPKPAFETYRKLIAELA